MYLDFYDLEKEPFNVTPDPEFFYLSPSHREALAIMIYGIEQIKGFIGIFGEVGVGKTTVLRSYLEGMDPSTTRLIYVINANLPFPDLLKTIYRELKLDIPTEDPAEMVSRLHEILIEEYKQNHNVALIIDEAQNVPDATLENLRMLSNLETSKDKLIQIVLIGQPELQQRLDQKGLRQLNQRIAVRIKIRPLTERESLEYIHHRLARAGAGEERIFTPGALKAIIKKAQGIPRIMNILCDNALITGFGYQQKPVTLKVAREIIADFEGRTKRSRMWWGVALSLLAFLVAAAGLLSFYKRPVSHEGITPARDDIKEKNQAASSAPAGSRPEATVDDSVAGSAKILRPLPPAPATVQEVTGDPAAKPEIREDQPYEPTPEVSFTPPVEPTDSSGKRSPAPEPEHPAGPEKPATIATRIVKRGDNLTRLIRDVYGYVDDRLVEWVRESNPHVQDINTLRIGTRVTFPPLPEDGSMPGNSENQSE